MKFSVVTMKDLFWVCGLAEDMCGGNYPPEQIEDAQAEVRRVRAALAVLLRGQFPTVPLAPNGLAVAQINRIEEKRAKERERARRRRAEAKVKTSKGRKK